MRELSTLCEGSAFCEDARACIQERDAEIERLQAALRSASHELYRAGMTFAAKAAEIAASAR